MSSLLTGARAFGNPCQARLLAVFDSPRGHSIDVFVEPSDELIEPLVAQPLTSTPITAILRSPWRKNTARLCGDHLRNIRPRAPDRGSARMIGSIARNEARVQTRWATGGEGAECIIARPQS